MNIYLDIDGVILANDANAANYAHEFIEYIVKNHTVYWLTTHCKGDADYTCRFLSRIFDEPTMVHLRKVKATNWDVNKTEAIDFSQPFLWFDDDLFAEEKVDLEKHKAMESFIEVDLSKDENQLQKFLQNFPTSVQQG